MAVIKIFEHAHRTPSKTAVVHNGIPVSYAEFARRIEDSRRYLARQELSVGSVAVVCAGSLLDAWVLGFALRSLGLITVVARGADPISNLRVRNVGCVVMTTEESRTDFVDDSGARLIRVPCDQTAPDTIPPLLETTTPQGGHIMMTSGTTGAYKKVVRDAATEVLAIPLHAEINAISDRSVVYVANFPLWSAGGYRWPLISWSMGATVVIHQASDLHRPLLEHDFTHLFTTPDALAALIAASKGNLRRNDGTRLLVTSGALPKAMLVAARQHLTDQVYSVLASTEALTIGVTRIEQDDDLLWHRIHPAREVQVVDEADRVLGPEQLGFVRVRVIDGVQGYLDDAAATREFFRDGYFYPGDVGMLGTDGRLSLGGRASDVVNVLGTKVATGPIERALEDRLGADGVCIVALQGDESEDEIHLAIQSRRRIELAELEAAADAALGPIKRVPVRIVFVESFPRNEMGKIQRLVLLQQLSLANKAKDRPA